MSDADRNAPTLDEALQALADQLAIGLEEDRARMLAEGMSPQQVEALTRYGAAMHASQIAVARAQILAKFSPR